MFTVNKRSFEYPAKWRGNFFVRALKLRFCGWFSRSVKYHVEGSFHEIAEQWFYARSTNRFERLLLYLRACFEDRITLLPLVFDDRWTTVFLFVLLSPLKYRYIRRSMSAIVRRFFLTIVLYLRSIVVFDYMNLRWYTDPSIWALVHLFTIVLYYR